MLWRWRYQSWNAPPTKSKHIKKIEEEGHRKSRCNVISNPICGPKCPNNFKFVHVNVFFWKCGATTIVNFSKRTRKTLDRTIWRTYPYNTSKKKPGKQQFFVWEQLQSDCPPPFWEKPEWMQKKKLCGAKLLISDFDFFAS